MSRGVILSVRIAESRRTTNAKKKNANTKLVTYRHWHSANIQHGIPNMRAGNVDHSAKSQHFEGMGVGYDGAEVVCLPCVCMPKLTRNIVAVCAFTSTRTTNIIIIIIIYHSFPCSQGSVWLNDARGCCALRWVNVGGGMCNWWMCDSHIRIIMCVVIKCNM